MTKDDDIYSRDTVKWGEHGGVGGGVKWGQDDGGDYKSLPKVVGSGPSYADDHVEFGRTSVSTGGWGGVGGREGGVGAPCRPLHVIPGSCRHRRLHRSEVVIRDYSDLSL